MRKAPANEVPDSRWKYVNERRLLVFVGASINHGMQWAVFEPKRAAELIPPETSWWRP